MKRSPVTPHVACETLHLGEESACEIFTLTPARSQGNWAAGSSAGSRWDGLHALPHSQALSVEK